MYKIIFIVFSVFINLSFAKEVSLAVIANQKDVTPEMSREQLLSLNGYRQAITNELLELKLDSELFWNKLGLKKLSDKEEALFLKTLFSNEMLSEATSADAKATIPEDEKITGHFKAELNLDQLKTLFLELTDDLASTRLKSFYLIAEIGLDPLMKWEDVGVQRPESFRGVILDSWKKLIEKEIKGFERVVILEKDLSTKPEYMNARSLTLKWTSTFKKTSGNLENRTASYELTAHFILQNSKSGSILMAFDFPIQKRDLDISNKKALSSTLASLVYNLLLSQITKIDGIATANSLSSETSELEVKVAGKASLSEIYQINTFLQEKFKDLKLSSNMKSYSSEGSTLIIKADGNAQKILDTLSAQDGKYDLNEQKILVFNRADKTFAIISKAPNN